MIRATLAALAALMLAGCATIDEAPFTVAESTFHVLNAADQAQSVNAISHDCFREVNPVTRGLLGDKPDARDFVLYGVALSLAFHVFNRLDWVQERPALRIVVDALAIGAKGWQVAHNANIGMSAWGDNPGCAP